MKVNIKGIWYDANIEPIAVKLSDADKENIKNMSKEADHYISFPDKMKWEDVKKQLNINK